MTTPSLQRAVCVLVGRQSMTCRPLHVVFPAVEGLDRRRSGSESSRRLISRPDRESWHHLALLKWNAARSGARGRSRRRPEPLMQLTPQSWSWNETALHAAWLTNCRADIPAVWQARLTDNPVIQSHLASRLSAEERIRLARFRLPEDQQRFLVGRGLLRLFVGTHLDLPAERVEFGLGPFGKPFVMPRAGAAPLHFNVSHSGQLVLLAFSPVHEVGVDVEAVRPGQDLENIARQVFASDELRGWLQLNPAERLPAFYQAWTRHEAGLKALGFGFLGERGATPAAKITCFDLELPAGYQGAVSCCIR